MDSPPRECEVGFSAIRAIFLLSLPLQSPYPTLDPAPQIFEGRCPHTTLTLLTLHILHILHTQGTQDDITVPTELPQPPCPTTPPPTVATHPPPHTAPTQTLATPQQPTTQAGPQRGHTSATMASWLGPTRFEASG